MGNLPQLRPSITKDGQAYVDEPIYAKPRADLATPISRGIGQIFGAREPRPILLRYEHTRLRWMKPDGKGGLVPRDVKK